MRLGLAIAVPLALIACGRAQNSTSPASEAMSVYDVEPPADEPAVRSGPQVAYTYALTYTLDGAAIGKAQIRAAEACRRLGVAKCLVIKTDLTRDGAGDTASLNLLIDARLANGFGQRLDRVAADAGGEATGRHVAAEDVTKQIVDTGARVRAKQALADRLLGIIRTANGKVGELIEAEKAYATVQEELDSARSLDAELRQRVAMSTVEITYFSRSASGTWAPLVRATDGLAGSFASSIAALVTFVAVALPWALLLALVVWLVRLTGWRPRWPFRRRAAPIA